MRSDTKDHLFKLADAYFDHLIFDSAAEYGSIGVDSKRPFGNSYVEGDILKIIGIPCPRDGYTDEQEEYARKLYIEKLIPFLKSMWKDYKNIYSSGRIYRREVVSSDKV